MVNNCTIKWCFHDGLRKGFAWSRSAFTKMLSDLKKTASSNSLLKFSLNFICIRGLFKLKWGKKPFYIWYLFQDVKIIDLGLSSDYILLFSPPHSPPFSCFFFSFLLFNFFFYISSFFLVIRNELEDPWVNSAHKCFWFGPLEFYKSFSLIFSISKWTDFI